MQTACRPSAITFPDCPQNFSLWLLVDNIDDKTIAFEAKVEYCCSHVLGGGFNKDDGGAGAVSGF